MKINKWLTSIIAIVPTVGTISMVTSCNNGGSDPEPEPESGSAEEYIKDRTFAIATLNASGSWITAGTAWILSDATKTEFTDYNYYIATNWHVKLGFDNKPGVGVGYHCSGMNNNVYQKFSGDVVWNTYTDFCFETSKDCAIDFYIAKVNFGTADTIPSAAKDRLDKLNALQKEKGYINKFGKKVSSSDNYASKKTFCGGYPGKNISGKKTQKWNFETVNADATLFCVKGTNYLGQGKHNGHKVSDTESPEIWDQSANYLHQSYFPCTYDSFLEQYIPSGWSLTGGASGSMMVTQENNEWVVIGIYWGGWTLTATNVYFSPAWSIFKSTDKNFIQNYE